MKRVAVGRSLKVIGMPIFLIFQKDLGLVPWNGGLYPIHQINVVELIAGKGLREGLDRRLLDGRLILRVLGTQGLS